MRTSRRAGGPRSSWRGTGSRVARRATLSRSPRTWAAQAGLLKERTKRVGAAEKKGKRNQRKDAIDAVGGLAFGAAFLGASWAVKEELLSAEAALGGIAARSKCPFGRTPSRLLRLLRGSRATGRPALPQVIELAAHSHRL